MQGKDRNAWDQETGRAEVVGCWLRRGMGIGRGQDQVEQVIEVRRRDRLLAAQGSRRRMRRASKVWRQRYPLSAT